MGMRHITEKPKFVHVDMRHITQNMKFVHVAPTHEVGSDFKICFDVKILSMRLNGFFLLMSR